MPAASRFPRIVNAPGATTKLRNTSAPSHRLKLNNSIVRKRVVTKNSFTPFWNEECRLTKNIQEPQNVLTPGGSDSPFDPSDPPYGVKVPIPAQQRQFVLPAQSGNPNIIGRDGLPHVSEF